MFRLTLARDLGKTLSELANTLGSSEIGLWKAYYTIINEKKPGK